jgi:uncharacterized membrane protein YbhN (UPF0104 family)
MRMKDPQSEKLIPELTNDAVQPKHSGDFGDSESKEDSKKTAFLKKACAFLVIVGVFYLLGKNLYQNLGEISLYQWKIRYEFLVLSFLCLVVNLAVASYAWKKILTLFHHSLPLDQSFKIMSVSATGKYVPGKVWQYLGQIYLGRKAGLPKSVTFFSMILLFLVYNLVGVLVFLFSLFFWRSFSPLPISVFSGVFISIFVVALYPPILNRVLKILFRLFKREPLTIEARFDQILHILLILLVDWIIFGIGAYLLLNSFYSIDLSQTVILCGIFAISVIAGILSFIVPAGLGVREGVQSYLLSLFIPVSMAILISLVMRVWIILGELACFLIALKIKKPKLS